MELTTLEHNILLGTLLGDGFLQKRSKKARLRICHSYKQKGFVDWKYFHLKRLCSRTRPPKKVQQKNGLVYLFATQSEKILANYHSLFYEKIPCHQGSSPGCFLRKGRLASARMPLEPSDRYRKKIDHQLLEYFQSPLSLAVWWLDDGSCKTNSRAGQLATHSFNLSENKILKKLLLQNFQINSNILKHIYRNKTYYYLYIPAKNNNFSHLINLISIYVHQIPSMSYKLGKPRNDCK